MSDFRPSYCTECQNTGYVDCYCGGDLCVCGEEEITCPACGGECSEIEDDVEASRSMIGYIIFGWISLGAIFDAAVYFGGRHSSDYGTKQHTISSGYVFIAFCLLTLVAWPVATWLMLRKPHPERPKPSNDPASYNGEARAEGGGP